MAATVSALFLLEFPPVLSLTDPRCCIPSLALRGDITLPTDLLLPKGAMLLVGVTLDLGLLPLCMHLW